MTRRPFDPRELDRNDEGLDHVADELERYARLTAAELPHGLDDRIMAALQSAPPPRRGVVGLLLAPFAGGPQRGVVRATMVAATMVLAILAVVAAGELAGLLPNDRVGSSPSPTTIQSASGTPSSSPTHSPTPSATPSPSATPVPTAEPTLTPRPSPAETPEATSQPTAHETPESEHDHSETPHPSDSGDDST